MFLTDYHIHSLCSPDAEDTMADMARASMGRGVGLLCFTDHCDLDWYETGLPDEHCFDYFPQAKAQFAAAPRLTFAAIFAKLHLFFSGGIMSLNGRKQK